MLRSFVSLALSVFLLASAAFAQSEVGGATLNGTVFDSSGGVVSGAKVTITGTDIGVTRTTETTSGGLYSFPRLTVGTYDISVELSGFKTLNRKGLNLGIGAVATVDLTLTLGTTAETVSVNGDISVVETTRSQTSTVVNERAVEELPINGRNFLDFTLLTPGVVRDPTRSGDLSFGGQRGTANSLLVDGTDANNVFYGQSAGRSGTGRSPYSFSQDAVQEFQVNTNGYAAEIGRAGGGVVNVITKSGSNQFHGSAFEFFRDKALNANSWENNRRGAPKRAYHFNQFGGSIGGPVVKNKLFFFFDYDGQRNTTPNTVFLAVAAPSDAASQAALASLQPFLQSYSNSLNNNVYLGKVDWQISGSQRFTFRYDGNRFNGVNFENSGNASALGHTGNSDVSTDNFAGIHTLVIGPKAVLESRFVYQRDNEPGQANSTDPEAVIRQSGTTVLSIGRNSFSPRYANLHAFQWGENFSYVYGRHTIKIGGDINFERIANYFPGNFSGSYTFNSYADFANKNPFSYTQAFAGAGTDGGLSNPDSNEYAVYLQDSWRFNDRLTLNYGIRYDFYKYAQPKVKNTDPGLAALGLDTSRIPKQTNNIGPRFGFAYKVDNAGTLVLRGGYGVYYGRTPSILTGTAFTQNGIQVQTYTLNTGIPTYPAILAAPPALNRRPDIFVFAPNFLSPLTQQWSFNIEKQLARDYAVTLGYLGVRGEHLARTRDINLFPESPVQGSYANGTPVTFLQTSASNRPNPNFGRISIADSGADSIYHGVFLQLTKRFAQRFQLQTSYTFSKVLDDAPDSTSVVVGADDAKNAQNTLAPNLERGRGNTDIRHRFVFSGVWDINYANGISNRVMRAILGGYQLSTIATLQSGRPYNITAGGDVNGDGTARTDRPPYVGRNTLDGPSFQNVDVRFTRDISVYRERAKLRLMFEAFNLTNRANYSSILTTQYNFAAATRVFTPVATFGLPTATFDPRILQLAARFTF